MRDMKGNDTGRDEVMFIDYLRVLFRRRYLIGAVTLASLIISVIVSLLLPRQYASTTSVLPPQSGSSIGIQALSQLQSGGIGSLSGILGQKTPIDVWQGIIRSQTVYDSIIERFGLRELYGKNTMESARGALDGNVSISLTKEDILVIKVYDTDPARAAKMAEAFVEELDRHNRELVMTSGSRKRAFLEKRLVEAKVDLVRAEEAIKAFQGRNGAVKLDEQSRAIIEAYGTVKGELMAREIELNTLLTYAAPTNPKAELLRAEVEGLKGKLREIENGEAADGRGSGAFIPLKRFPELSLQFARLFRDAKVQETLYELLTQQLELARIDEANDTPTVQVLDHAKVPEQKAKPRRALIVLLSTFSGAFASVIMAFVLEYAAALRAASTSEWRRI
ncbi:MAG: hypothetical protein HY893_02865 [Deltaproteobacteria bacterium]|nr:hypothetical protein [Deltaproteobacteria bacterium]